MRTRPLTLPLATLLLLGSPLLAACSGDDDKKDSEKDGDPTETASGVGAEPGEPGVPGPKKPSTVAPSCPFGEKALNAELGTKFELAKNSCVFTTKKGARISITLDAAAENKTYEKTRKTYEKTADEYAALEVPGQAYAAWTEDELNISIGYLDNAGEYRFQVSALPPDDAGSDSVEDLAGSLLTLVVAKRDEG